MTLAERALYHQIHPAKLFADISTALIGIDLFWRHELAPGLIIALFTPVLVSAVLLREADLERYRSSPMGAYLRRFMPPWVQAVRLFGVLVAFYASWHHVPAAIYGRTDGSRRRPAECMASTTREASRYGERDADALPHRQGRARSRRVLQEGVRSDRDLAPIEPERAVHHRDVDRR